MRRDRYYIHVYQTRIGPERRTLRSKGIARELTKRFGELYWPRDMDKQEGVRGNAEANRRIIDRDTRRKTSEVNRPNGRRSNVGGYAPGDGKERIKPMNRREEQGTGRTWELRHTKQRNHWKQDVSQQNRWARSDWRPRQNEKGGQNLEDLTNQLKRLTNILDGLVLGGRNL